MVDGKNILLFFKNGQVIDLSRFKRKDVRVLQEVIFNIEGKHIDKWVNGPWCDAHEKIYLSGPELEKYVREHGYSDLCVGPKGGVYVPIDKFKGVKPTHLEHDNKIGNKKKIFGGNIKTSKVDVGYIILNVDSNVARWYERFLKSKEPQGSIVKNMSIMLFEEIKKVKDVDITNISPTVEYEINNFDDILDSISLVGVISFLNMKRDDVERLVEYLKFMRKHGMYLKEEKVKDEILSFMISGVILDDLDLLLDLYDKYWETSDVNKRKFIIGEFFKERGNILASLNVMGDILSNQFRIYKEQSKRRYTADNSIVIDANLYDKYFNKLALDEKHVKKVIVLAGIISSFFGIDIETSLAISKGITLMSFRMSGSFSTNSYYIDEFLKRFVYGNGRPSRVVSRGAQPTLYILKFFRMFGNPLQEFKAYHNFVKMVARSICGGDECEVARGLNLGESLFLSRNMFIDEIIDVVKDTYGEDSKQYKVIRNFLSKLKIDKLYGYTISTSFGIGAEKMLAHRKWMGGILVKMNVFVDDVIATPLSANSGYLDDTEFTILVPKDGLKFSIEKVISERDVEGFSQRLTESIKDNDFVVNVLYSNSKDVAEIIKDDWVKYTQKYFEKIMSWYSMELKLFAGIEKDEDYYKEIWSDIIQSVMFAVDKWWLVSKYAGISKAEFENEVRRYLINKQLWNDIASLKSSTKDEKYSYGRQLELVRSPYLKDFPKYFEEAVEKYNSIMGRIGFGGEYWKDVTDVIREVW